MVSVWKKALNLFHRLDVQNKDKDEEHYIHYIYREREMKEQGNLKA